MRCCSDGFAQQASLSLPPDQRATLQLCQGWLVRRKYATYRRPCLHLKELLQLLLDDDHDFVSGIRLRRLSKRLGIVVDVVEVVNVEHLSIAAVIHLSLLLKYICPVLQGTVGDHGDRSHNNSKVPTRLRNVRGVPAIRSDPAGVCGITNEIKLCHLLYRWLFVPPRDRLFYQWSVVFIDPLQLALQNRIQHPRAP